MPLRIKTLSFDEQAVTDVPDDSLVLDTSYEYVVPEPGITVMMYGTKIPVSYTPFAADASTITAWIDHSSGVEVMEVQPVENIEYNDLPLIVVPATSSCRCEDLTYVKVQPE